MSARLLKEKYETLNKLLGDEYVLVHLDSTKEGVTLPAHIMNTSQVTLKLSRLFRGELVLTESQISSYLRFDSDYFHCIVPLEAIWGATSTREHNIIWPESAPKDILTNLTQSTIKGAQKSAAPAKSAPKKKSGGVAKRKVSHLRRVK